MNELLANERKYEKNKSYFIITSVGQENPIFLIEFGQLLNILPKYGNKDSFSDKMTSRENNYIFEIKNYNKNIREDTKKITVNNEKLIFEDLDLAIRYLKSCNLPIAFGYSCVK